MPPTRPPLADQDTPVVLIIGRLRGEKIEDNPVLSGIRYLVTVSWTRRVYTISAQLLEGLRLLDITVLDNSEDYMI